MRRLLILVTMLAATIALVAPSASAAQIDPQDVPGLEAIWGRTYSLDTDQLPPASPSASPGASPVGVQFTVSIEIEAFVFDNAGTATMAFGLFGDTVAGLFFEHGPKPTGAPVAGLGDGAMHYVPRPADHDNSALYIFRNDAIGYAVYAIGTSPAVADRDARAFADAIYAAEPGSAPVQFDEDGGSTGGVFDTFPSGDAIPIPGLEISHDRDLMRELEDN